MDAECFRSETLSTTSSNYLFSVLWILHLPVFTFADRNLPLFTMTEPPDPKTLESWEDAFQYPIVVVRGMERQLRSEIDSNRERLRSLVGYGQYIRAEIESQCSGMEG